MHVENHLRNTVHTPSMKKNNTAVKPYNCEACGKSFALSGILKQHVITHTGVKHYTCDTCGKSFAQSRTLTDHQTTQTGVNLILVTPVKNHSHNPEQSRTTTEHIHV